MKKTIHDNAEEELVHFPLYNLHSGDNPPSRIADLVVDKHEGLKLFLQVKLGKNRYETIPWDYLSSQIDNIRNQIA